MEGQTLSLSNRGLTGLDEIYGMIAQYSQNILMLDLSGNYLK